MIPPGLPTASLKALVLTVTFCSAVALLYSAAQMEPSPLVSLIVVGAPVIAAVMWLRADARARHVPLVYDMGLFLWVAWPVLIPWYAVRTRGRHGWPLGVLILVAIVTPILLAYLVDLMRWWSSGRF